MDGSLGQFGRNRRGHRPRGDMSFKMASPSGSKMASPESEQERRAPVRYCAVYTCLHNYRSHPHLAYFSIPSEKNRCRLWLKKIHRMDIWRKEGVSGYHRVCEAHFDPSDISVNKNRRRLSRRAVPSLLLPRGEHFVNVVEHGRPAPAPLAPPSPTPPTPPPAPPPVSLPASAPPPTRARTLTASALEVFQYIDKTPKRHARKRQRFGSKPGIYRPPPAPVTVPPASLADFFAACERHLNPKMAEFVKMVAQLRQKDREGANEVDSLCVKMLLAAPAAYRLLQPALALPPARALRHSCAPLLLDFNAQLTDLLRVRVDRMTEKEKHCTVSVDFIDVKPHLYYNITFDRIIGLHEIDGTQEPWPAKRCAVLSVSAILASWAQPAALCFLAHLDDGIHEWIDGVIRRLLTIGLKVHALVTDPAAVRRKGVSPASPFFHVDHQKIYHIYDPSRLMKLLLCNFMTHDFHFEKSVAKWNDVVQYRKIEKHKPLTLTPQLTDAHTSAGGVQRMRPRRAARVLSRALAAALASYAERGLLGASAPATVKFILKINELFDVLDSTATNTGRDRRKSLSEDSGHIGFLSYMKSFFKALKLKDSSGVEISGSGDLGECWQVSITAVLALREELEPVQPYLLTRRLHLDDRVAEAARRASGVRGGRPTCRQMFAAFKKQFFDDILQPSGDGTNVDLNSLLMRVSSGNGQSPLDADRFKIEEEPEVRAEDYRQLRVRRRGALAAVGAQLLGAVLREHGCCAAGAAYASRAPSDELLQLLCQLDEALAAALRARQPAHARLQDLLLDLHVLECDLPCACFPLQYIKKLFLRFRLYRILKQNQAAFKNCDDDDDVKFNVDTLE